MTEKLDGKLALVTGAAGGVGRAVCQALIDDGLRIVLVDLDRKRLDGLVEELGAGAIPIALDISDADAVAGTCTGIRREHGEVAVLINNAGVLSNNKTAETDPEEWRRLMSVNLDGAFFLSREWLPGMMAAGWGRIVNLCSLAMKSGGLTAGTAYTASKGGLAALTFSLAREAAGHGVTVNGIAPAHVLTPMVTDQLTEAQRRELLTQIPVGRFCEPEEVAHTVRFLVSPLAGFITGEIIDMNGGLHMD